jgi:hypothetical protein
LKEKTAEHRADLAKLAQAARKREDELKMALASALKARIQEKILEKKARERKQNPKKK